MNYPQRALDRFEDKHGTYDELIDKYLTSKHWDNDGKEYVTPETTKYLKLLEQHRILIALYTGYAMALRDIENEKMAKRKNDTPPDISDCQIPD